MQHDQTRTSTQTAAPTTQAPAQAGPAAAPSNAARQESLGLGGEVPAAADTGDLIDTVRAMGSLGEVVLDALPVQTAIQVVLGIGPVEWAALWLAKLGWEVLVDTGALEEMVANKWPVGVAVEGIAGGEFEAVAGVPLGALLRFARTPEGFVVQAKVEAGLQKEASVGAKLTGAFGDAVLAATAGGSIGVNGSVEGEWTFSIKEVIARLAEGEAPEQVVADLQGRISQSLTRELDRAELSAVRIHGELKAAVDGAASPPGTMVDASASRSAEAAFGFEEGKRFVEIAFDDEGRACADANLLKLVPDFFGLASLLERGIGSGGSLRIEFDDQGGVFDPRRFVLTRTLSTTGRKESEKTESASAGPILEAAGALDCGTDFPELDLRHAVEVDIEDEALKAPLIPPILSAAADFMPDHSVIAGVAETKFHGDLLVPSDAVVAAWNGQPPFTDGEDMLDAERMLLAPLLGRRMEGPEAPAPEAGRALIRPEKAEVVARVKFGVGIGGGLTAGAEVGAKVHAASVLEVRHPIEGVLDGEQQKALLAG